MRHRVLALVCALALVLTGCGRDPYDGIWHRVGGRRRAMIDGKPTRIPATIQVTRRGERTYTIREDSLPVRPAWSAKQSKLIAYVRDVDTWEISYDWTSGHLVMTYDSSGGAKDVVVEYER